MSLDGHSYNVDERVDPTFSPSVCTTTESALFFFFFFQRSERHLEQHEELATSVAEGVVSVARKNSQTLHGLCGGRGFSRKMRPYRSGAGF